MVMIMNDLLPHPFCNVNRPSHSEIQLYQNLTMKIHGQGHVCGQRSRSRLIFKFQRSRLWSRSNPSVTFEAWSSIDMFAFPFVAIGPLLAEIWSDCHERKSKHINWTPGLKFISFLHTDMTQVVEILPQVRQILTYSTQSKSWVLMSCWCKEPGHPQPWYWLCWLEWLDPPMVRVKNVIECTFCPAKY